MIKIFNILNIYLMQLNNIVIMAAAGAGKTYDICKDAIENAKTTDKKILITTYTNKGIESIEKEYKKQNHGVIDKNIVILSWFQFLLRELVKPYQSSILSRINVINSIDFNHQYGYINFNSRRTPKHYILSNNNILSNTVSEFAIDSNTNSNNKVIQRLEEIYSYIYIDEIQDLAGEDIEILNLLFNSRIKVQCVGDVKQSTYTTYNAKKNKKVTGIHLIDYFKKLERNCIITLKFNNKTRRFGTEICEFSNSIFNDDNKIESDTIYDKENQGVYILERRDFEDYYKIYEPQILKHDSRTKLDYNSLNFGQCKGMTFNRVAIFPNKKYKEFLQKGTNLDSPCKNYVSATRAKYSIVFVVDKLFENSKFKYTNIALGEEIIKVSKYIINMS